MIPHQDGAGVIDRVGAGVPESRLGERVWLFESQFGRPFGSAAEYTVQPSGHVVRMPDSVAFEQGACLGVPAMTAHRCLFADGPLDGKVVLVPGGAGAVGHYAVQEAKLAGATVISTISSDYKADIARDAGADHTINYRTEDVVERVMDITGGEGVDHIVEVDFAANFPVTSEVLNRRAWWRYTRRGRDSSLRCRCSSAAAIQWCGMCWSTICRRRRRTRPSADITAWLEAGALTHLVGPHFPLEQTVRAAPGGGGERHRQRDSGRGGGVDEGYGGTAGIGKPRS